ncbi:MAG: hypothetical protein Q4B57_01985 [Eubacteriales bacterium]|nr:hypothetical protein [Eubacteriales bacterium]
MLNEQRIYLMTRLAIFEKEHKDQLYGIETYFRSDYIGRHMIKNGFRITIAYLLMLLGWGLYNVETLILDITKIDVMALVSRILFLYAALLAVFLVVTYILQTIRYARARQDLYEYRELLQQLERLYEEEDAAKRMMW